MAAPRSRLFDGAVGPLDVDAVSSAAQRAALSRDDRVILGERLKPAPTATTVREGEGELLLTDGPIAHTKEVTGGF